MALGVLPRVGRGCSRSASAVVVPARAPVAVAAPVVAAPVVAAPVVAAPVVAATLVAATLVAAPVVAATLVAATLVAACWMPHGFGEWQHSVCLLRRTHALRAPSLSVAKLTKQRLQNQEDDSVHLRWSTFYGLGSTHG